MPEENIKIYTIDASFMLAFLLPDEQSEQVKVIFDQYLQGRVNFIAPLILPFEVTNSLKNAIPKRIAQRNAIIIIKDFLKLRIELIETDLEKVFDLSLTNGLSVYDASYLYLAQNNNVPLLTLDKKLKSLF